MRLAISLPTRGRPDRIIDTVKRSAQNWRESNTVLWIMADKDDLPTIEAVSGIVDDQIKLSIKEREDTIAAKWNRILALEPDADVYLAGADDDPYTTPGYDSRILDAAKRFPDGIGMVYGHMANASFSRAVAPTRGLVRKLGYMFPEYFPYWFVDHWTDDVAKLIGRISFADIMTDQNNPGKTQEMRETGWWATWFDAAYCMRLKQAADIINSEDFVSPDWLKDILLTHGPLIMYRSRWVNNHVRSMAQTLDRWSGLKNTDARYQRLRNKAVEMVPHLLDDYGMGEYERNWFRQALIPSAMPNLQRAFG